MTIKQDDQQQYGKLAYQYGSLLPLEILRSAAGFYIGTTIEEQNFCEPNTRESVEYWSTEEQATKAFETGNWTQRQWL